MRRTVSWIGFAVGVALMSLAAFGQSSKNDGGNWEVQSVTTPQLSVSENAYIRSLLVTNNATVGSLTVTTNATVGGYVSPGGTTNQLSASGTNGTWNGATIPTIGTPASTAIQKGNGSGGLTPATPGTDYLAPFSISSQSYSSSITLNLSTNADRWLVLAGNTTLSTTAVTSNVLQTIRIDADSSDRTIITPSGWRYMSGAQTNTLYAYKVGHLVIKSYGSSDTNILASWISE